jgi:hypothetical protein
MIIEIQEEIELNLKIKKVIIDEIIVTIAEKEQEMKIIVIKIKENIDKDKYVAKKNIEEEKILIE